LRSKRSDAHFATSFHDLNSETSADGSGSNHEGRWSSTTTAGRFSRAQRYSVVDPVADEQQLVQAGYDKLSSGARRAMNGMVTQAAIEAKVGRLLGFTKLAPLHGNLMVFEDRWVYGMEAMHRDPNSTPRPDTAIGYKTGDRYREVLSWGPRIWGP
jgi:hypothetical protein